jgi:MoxR-like ATPase
MWILRGMQLPKAVLLEGSPGVGKTSLVSALAAAAGHPLVRINLSEQTDIMDLLGSDLPVEGQAWRALAARVAAPRRRGAPAVSAVRAVRAVRRAVPVSARAVLVWSVARGASAVRRALS